MSGELTGAAGLRDHKRGRVKAAVSRLPPPASRPAGARGEEPSSRAEGGGGARSRSSPALSGAVPATVLLSAPNF